MSDLKISMRSTIEENQKAYILEKVKEDLKKSKSKEETKLIVDSAMSRFDKKAGSPLFEIRRAERGQVPFMEDVLENMEEISEDISTMYKEHNNSTKFVVDSFNYVHSEKKRILSKIGGLSSLVGDLNLIAHEKLVNNIYFKESFEDPKAFDSEFSIDSISKAQISSGEGILTLARESTENLSETATIASLNGNGEVGTQHLARRVQLKDKDGNTVERYVFVDSNAAMKNDDSSVLLDNRPDTIFEYQMVNVPTSFINSLNRYDFEWVKGEKSGDRLRLKLVIELNEVRDLNWINLNPYYPPNSTNKIQVYSIRTSEDGFEYVGLFEKENNILNHELNESSQTYRIDDLFDGSNELANAKYTGQGVWSFPHRKTKFVEIVLDQTESYPEVVGQEVYYVRTKDQDYWTQVAKVKELEDMDAGEYTRQVNGEALIYLKQVQATNEGWRHVIGIRDINLMSYLFEEKSSFISKRYEANGEISKVMLYANEKIPNSYMELIKENNSWIKYELSFDDTNWFEISPMHHEPVSDVFPPKIIEVNGNEIDLASAFQVHKQLVKTEEKATGVRIRITLKRPIGENFNQTTPILEDFALRVVKKEVSI